MSGPKLLIVEDDGDIRDILRARLTAAGFDISAARHGKEAMRELDARTFEGMILDLNMPELDGFGVLRRVRAKGLLLPRTMVLTARHAAEDVRLAVSLGAKDYLTKPFTEAQLLSRVARLMRIAQPIVEI